MQIEKGAALLFNSTDADLYKLWVGEALPTYPAGADAGGPLRYRAHLDCDGCRCGARPRALMRSAIRGSLPRVLPVLGEIPLYQLAQWLDRIAEHVEVHNGPPTIPLYAVYCEVPVYWYS